MCRAGFREESLEESLEASLRRFLSALVPAGELADRVRYARAELLAAGDWVVIAFAPLATADRVHQFGIDCRLCWNAEAHRGEFPFLEAQFGIGRVSPEDVGADALPGYRTPDELRALFG